MLVSLLKSLWRTNPDTERLLESAKELRKQDRGHDSLAIYQDLVFMKGVSVDVIREAAQLAMECKQNNLAIAFLKQALSITPDDFALQTNLSVLLKATGDVHGAIECGEAAMKLAPERFEAIYNLALLRDELGEHKEAERLHRQAILLAPDFEPAHNSLICLLDQLPGVEPSEMLNARKRWAERYPLPTTPRNHRNIRDPQKILNVGYVSADFKAHPSAYFVTPLFSKHDRNRVKVHCYYNWPEEDEMSRQIQSLVAVWRNIHGMDDQRVAALIEDDGIDILVDLSGHTVGNKLGLFASQISPIQATYMGYLGSSGLPQIQYRISDAMLDPLGMTESNQTETVVRTNGCCVCFSPDHNAPQLNELPALKNGTLTFGSVNARRKLNETVLTSWRELLLEVVDSKLIMILAHGERPSVCGAMLDFFASGGVDPQRISIRGRQNLEGFFSCIQECDLMLDPFPYNGGTTTFHSLWMGVPVITLAGKSALARCGLMIMESIGLPEFVAHSRDEYVKIGRLYAESLPALAQIRASLRQKFIAAPFADSSRVALEVENIYRKLWQDWCETSPRLEI
ncbi:MAG: hypothetical protein JWN23_2033 [Rhodocyclales bacterium]|nr:hypothetical protein [Rhodocyclales bacterium]